jgi:hypothetical protein
MKLIKLEQHYFIIGKSHKVLICGIPKINTFLMRTQVKWLFFYAVFSQKLSLPQWNTSKNSNLKFISDRFHRKIWKNEKRADSEKVQPKKGKISLPIWGNLILKRLSSFLVFRPFKNFQQKNFYFWNTFCQFVGKPFSGKILLEWAHYWVTSEWHFYYSKFQSPRALEK